MAITISEDEISFIVNSIAKNVRMDSRDMNEERNQHVTFLAHEFYEKSVKVVRGNSEIELYINFAETDGLLSKFNLEYATTETSKSQNIQNIKQDFDLKKYFSDFTQRFNLDLQISVNILSDDGGIFSMVCDALSFAFQSFSAPLFKTSKEYDVLEYKISIPKCVVFAVFDTNIVRDPISTEIEASDSVYTILLQNDNIDNISFVSRLQNNEENFIGNLEQIRDLLL